MGNSRGISVFVSTTPFAEHDRTPTQWMNAAGWRVCVNDTRRKLTSQEVAERARDCEAIIAGTEDLNALLDANRRLKIIARVGVGLDSVPLERCRERNIAVAYTPDAVTPAVAEFAVGAMIAACRDIPGADRNMRGGGWRRTQGIRIGESRIGIVGFGRIGSTVGRLLAGFAPAALLVHDVLDKRADIAALPAGAAARQASLNEILETCDIVSLHVPLRQSTRGLIGARELRRMRGGSYLINTARGGIVDEDALYDALRSGHLGGAAVDVFGREPYTGPLRELDRVVLTAHMGSCSIDCRSRMERDATAEIVRFFSGDALAYPVPDDEYANQA
ncbi:MAG: phosphoglycerate dehydrogenase [Rhizomicrobium sp.]